MKILQVINSLDIGGAELSLAQICSKLQALDIDITIYVLKSSNSTLETEIRKNNIKVIHSNFKSLYSPLHILSLIDNLKFNHYDLVHVHLYPAQLWTIIATKLTNHNIPLVTTEHSTNNRRRNIKFFHPIDRWMYNNYSSIVVISKATASNLVSWLPELQSKLIVIPNGIPIKNFLMASSLDKKILVGNEHVPLLLFAARFDIQKDHETILKAMPHIPEAHLMLAGDGPRRNEMEQLSVKLGIADRVHFLGTRHDIPQLIKAADIYVQSSHWEGFGIAALEAMAGGLPVIASRVPGLSEVVADAGILFTPGDENELSKQINNLLHDPQKRQTLARKGYDRAKLFNINHTVNQYLELYNKLLSSNS